jgi:CRISPR/Cas system-associated endoribonuclease Cas2/predicted transposase YbfD/YdcC
MAYDIANDKKHTKVHTIPLGYDKWTQYSLFECFLTSKQLVLLHSRLSEHLVAQEDNTAQIRTLLANGIGQEREKDGKRGEESENVDKRTNEIPYAQIYLSLLPLAGRVCTADALHTQTDFLRAVLDLYGHVVLTVKQNQSTLYDDLALYFADPAASFEQAETIDRHRGRKEIRRIKVTAALGD